MPLSFAKSITTVLLLVFICAEPIHAQAIGDLFGNPDGAEQFDYCAWRFDNGADTTGFGIVQATLDKEEEAEPESVMVNRISAMLINAGVEIAQASKNAKGCTKDFDNGRKDYEKVYAKYSRKLNREEKISFSGDQAIAGVQRRISELRVEDQARRRVYIAKRDDTAVGASSWARALSNAYAGRIDAASTAYMKEVLEQFDWIDIQRFGGRISNHAWLLVQHADRDPAFQALALERMTPYLETGGVRKANYAYLYDRVAVNHDREQLYGTQPIWECTDNGLELAPLKEPETVNERRAAFGMNTVEESLAGMTASVCGK